MMRMTLLRCAPWAKASKDCSTLCPRSSSRPRDLPSGSRGGGPADDAADKAGNPVSSPLTSHNQTPVQSSVQTTPQNGDYVMLGGGHGAAPHDRLAEHT
jgi:hypothetical protein